MEGGVAILLLLIIVVVAGGIAIVMYLTGGALWLSKDKDGRDQRSEPRPEHKHVTSKTIENTEVVGTRRDDS
jgi:flagellar basal body-associated protein FliL